MLIDCYNHDIVPVALVLTTNIMVISLIVDASFLNYDIFLKLLNVCSLL